MFGQLHKAMGATQSAAGTLSLLGLSHVGVKASDIESSCAFYREFLGYAEQCRLNYLTTGELMLVCFKINDDQWIEVFTGLRAGENRMHQVAFRTSDAELIRIQLREYGVAVPPTTPKGQMGNFNFVVTDPSGQIVEFVQPLPSGITEGDRGRLLPGGRIATRLRSARIISNGAVETTAFYRAINFELKENGAAPDSNDSDRLLRGETANGDYIEFVLNPAAGAMFNLEVADLEEAKQRLERSRYRPCYRHTLSVQRGRGGQRFLDLFDPDETVVRLTEV